MLSLSPSNLLTGEPLSYIQYMCSVEKESSIYLWVKFFPVPDLECCRCIDIKL